VEGRHCGVDHQEREEAAGHGKAPAAGAAREDGWGDEAAAIVFQMGRARLASRGTTLKSTILARPEARSIVLSAGPARWPFSAWAATMARRAGPRHGPIFGGPIGGPIKIFNHI
jgi:hypothetical protein